MKNEIQIFSLIIKIIIFVTNSAIDKGLARKCQLSLSTVSANYLAKISTCIYIHIHTYFHTYIYLNYLYATYICTYTCICAVCFLFYFVFIRSSHEALCVVVSMAEQSRAIKKNTEAQIVRFYKNNNRFLLERSFQHRLKHASQLHTHPATLTLTHMQRDA